MNYDISLISVLRGIKLEGNFEQNFIDGLITSNPECINQTLLDRNFIGYHGVGTVERICNSTNLVIHSTIDFLTTIHGTDNIERISRNTYGFMELFVQCFWLVKDCCVYQSNLFTNIPTHKRTFVENSISVFSKANGEYEDSTFTKSELQKVMALTLKIRPLFTVAGKDTRPDPKINEYRYGSHKYIKAKELGRVDRAWQFLFYARSTTSVSLKISFYVMALESLFSGDGSEIAHKVSERVAIYLGDSAKQEKETFALVKKIYGFRSKYVHGNPVEIENMDLVSTNADELLRKVMLKVFLEDYTTFNSSKKLEEYLTGLIFREEKVKK